MFEPIGNLIAKQSKTRRTVLNAASVAAAAEDAITELFGASVASGMRVVSFYIGTLKLSCDKPVVAQEAAMRTDELRRAINRRLDSESVQRIVVR